MFLAKACVWFSVVSVMEDDHMTRAKGCDSATCVNTVLSPLLYLCSEKRLFLAPSANPFCFQVTGSNTRFFTYKVFMVALVLVSFLYTFILQYSGSFFRDICCDLWCYCATNSF